MSDAGQNSNIKTEDEEERTKTNGTATPEHKPIIFSNVIQNLDVLLKSLLQVNYLGSSTVSGFVCNLISNILNSDC